MENLISSKEYRTLLSANNVGYIGKTTQSAKIRKSYEHKTETYCIYLAPWNLSGRNVCPGGEHCHKLCLNESGVNKALSLKFGENTSINASRIRKTNWFYKDRESFMKCVIFEINKFKKHAEDNGMKFAVRLNGTSDLSPKIFKINGQNILQLFPDITFYDYTKVANRSRLTEKYSNYYLVTSFDGYNIDLCEEELNNGNSVAVVFDCMLPKTWHGYKVIDGNESDIRFNDRQANGIENGKGFIVGLTYHKTANDYRSGHYVRPTSKFVVNETDPNCRW